MTDVALTAEDRAILDLESETIAGHTCKVVHLPQRPPDLAGLRARIAARIHLAPALTRRLHHGTGGVPVWRADPDFDVARHVVAHHHDDPVDHAGLARCVARLFEQRLDREHPLWRIDLIQLRDGERALVWRIHHALADGTASVRYGRALLWDDPPRAPTPDLPTAQWAAQAAEAAHAADDARRRRHLAGYVRRELAGSRHRSPFDGPLCERREVAFAAVPLGPLRDAAHRIDGATLNDAVLSIVAGALRHWVEVHHGRLGTVRVKVPVSLHHEGDAEANHDSMFSLGLPLSEGDPAARLSIVHARTRARKEAQDAQRRELYIEQLTGVSPRLAQLADRLEHSPRRFALNVSNVPGPRRPVSILDSPVRALYSLAEIARHHALRVSVISMDDRLCFGFCVDPDVVSDVATIADAIGPEAEALLAAAAEI